MGHAGNAGGGAGGHAGAVDAGTDGSALVDCGGLVCGADQQGIKVISPALGKVQCACVPAPSGRFCTDCTCGAAICASYFANWTGSQTALATALYQNLVDGADNAKVLSALVAKVGAKGTALSPATG